MKPNSHSLSLECARFPLVFHPMRNHAQPGSLVTLTHRTELRLQYAGQNQNPVGPQSSEYAALLDQQEIKNEVGADNVMPMLRLDWQLR